VGHAQSRAVFRGRVGRAKRAHHEFRENVGRALLDPPYSLRLFYRSQGGSQSASEHSRARPWTLKKRFLPDWACSPFERMRPNIHGFWRAGPEGRPFCLRPWANKISALLVCAVSCAKPRWEHVRQCGNGHNLIVCNRLRFIGTVRVRNSLAIARCNFCNGHAIYRLTPLHPRRAFHHKTGVS